MTRADERISVLEGKIDGLEKGIEVVRSDMKAEITEMVTQFNGRLDGLEAGLNAKLEALLRQLTLDKGKGLAADSGMGSVRAAATPTVPVIPPENVGCYGRTRTAPTPAKLELPYFSGEDPSAWISRAEQYFRIDNTTEDMKIELALIAMKGPTLQWLQWMLSRFPTMGWSKFTTELLRRYGDDPRSNPYEALVATRQTGTVDEYCDEFILRLSSVPNLSDAVALGMFLNGLKDEIRWKIRSKDAEEIEPTMHLAREIEMELAPPRPSPRIGNNSFNRPFPPRNNYQARSGRNPATSVSTDPPGTGIGDTDPSASVPSPSDTGQPPTVDPRAPNTPIRSWGANYMTHTEYGDLRARGLCYKCKERYHPAHVYSKKSFGLILLDDNEDGEPAGLDSSTGEPWDPP